MQLDVNNNWPPCRRAQKRAFTSSISFNIVSEYYQPRACDSICMTCQDIKRSRSYWYIFGCGSPRFLATCGTEVPDRLNPAFSWDVTASCGLWGFRFNRAVSCLVTSCKQFVSILTSTDHRTYHLIYCSKKKNHHDVWPDSIWYLIN